MPKKLAKIQLPNGEIQEWPYSLAYSIWLAIPGTKWLIALILAVNTCFADDYVVTAYCNSGDSGNGCKICCGKWAKYNKTASGTTPKAGRTCAAPRSIPFGTKLEIEGVGIRVVEDRLGVRFDNRVDIFFETHKEALKFGKKKLKVRIIK